MSLRRAVTLGIISLAGLAWSGCEGKKQTEFVAGISTQVRVPKDLKTIRVDVLVGGTQVKCDSYRVYDGKVQLPKTLGTLPISADNRGLPVTITVAGYSEERLESTAVDQFADCVNTRIELGTNAAKGRILRSTRQTYSPDKIIFLPMPLSFACFDKIDCKSEETCKAGRCAPMDADPAKLTEFSEAMVNGAATTCFSVERCITPTGQTPFVLDPAKCLYAHPGSAGAPSLPAPAPAIPKDGDGLNVRAFFDGGEVAEVLDFDADEGYFVPDPAKPQQFQLAPGLCDLVKGVDDKGNPTAHRISGLLSAGLCQSKSQRQPICEKEANKLMAGNEAGTVTPREGVCQTFEIKATPNALLVLLDGSVRLSDFYSDTTVSRALGLSLADPAFEATQLGLKIIPQGVDCTNRVFPTLDVPLQPALKAQTAIALKIADFVSKKSVLEPIATPLKLDAALDAAYSKLNEATFASFSRKGVLILGNRDFAATKCTAGTKLVDVVKRGKLNTYALLLGDSAAPADPELVEAASSAGTNLKLYDSRKDQVKGSDAFSQVTRDLTSCLYDAPKGAIDEKAEVSYYDPVRRQTVSIKPSQGCAEPTGWTSEGGKVRFCPGACDKLVSTLRDRSDLALALGNTAQAVPIFASVNCK
jgi:hypothetical protein